MKPRDELYSMAIHEAGHVAACLNLDLPFEDVYLNHQHDHPGIVEGLVRSTNIDYSSGVLTPGEESTSTSLVIAALAGPACEALHDGRTAFDITAYEDLNEVLDIIEYRFANNTVRMAFARYCEAEAFALFEDDRRLWRYAHVLARELLRHKKLSYAQCVELYNKEYLVESWVRREVEEIKRMGGHAPSVEQRAEQTAEAASFKLQAARGKEELEAPGKESQAAGGQPAEGRRGKRRSRGRGRGRGRRGRAVSGELSTGGGGMEPHPALPVQDSQPPRSEATQEQVPVVPAAAREEGKAAGHKFRVEKREAAPRPIPVQEQRAKEEVQGVKDVRESGVQQAEKGEPRVEPPRVVETTATEPRPLEGQPVKRSSRGRGKGKGAQGEAASFKPQAASGEQPRTDVPVQAGKQTGTKEGAKDEVQRTKDIKEGGVQKQAEQVVPRQEVPQAAVAPAAKPRPAARGGGAKKREAKAGGEELPTASAEKEGSQKPSKAAKPRPAKRASAVPAAGKAQQGPAKEEARAVPEGKAGAKEPKKRPAGRRGRGGGTGQQDITAD